jgi:ketosteroid isomerase-like protein
MKQNIFVTIICIAGLFAFYTCFASLTTPTDLEKIKKAIEDTNTLYFKLFAKKDSAIVDLYTTDASLMIPNGVAVTGRKALMKDFEETFAAGKIQGVKFKTTQVYGNSTEYITEEGTWQVFDTKGSILDDGKYLKIWKKTSNGWKIFRDVFNSNH